MLRIPRCIDEIFEELGRSALIEHFLEMGFVPSNNLIDQLGHKELGRSWCLAHDLHILRLSELIQKTLASTSKTPYTDFSYKLRTDYPDVAVLLNSKPVYLGDLVNHVLVLGGEHIQNLSSLLQLLSRDLEEEGFG